MRLSKTFAVLTALTAWVALGLQLYILIDNVPANGLTVLQAIGRFFIFFTILTNLLVAICLTSIIFFPASGIARFFSGPSNQAAIVVYIFIVGLIYNIILRQLWEPEGWQRVTDELLHVIVPVLFTVYWLLFVVKGSLTWKHPFSWLLYPAVYLVYALSRGAIEGYYAYPFIDIPKSGYIRVTINATGILILFLVTGFMVVAIDKWLSRPKSI